AIDRHHAFTLVLRQIERRDDLTRLFDLARRWRKRLIAGLDLARVNERLAVESELEALGTFRGKAIGISDVVVNAVENFDAINARGRHAHREPCQHRGPPWDETRARVLGEIVGAHHK